MQCTWLITKFILPEIKKNRALIIKVSMVTKITNLLIWKSYTEDVKERSCFGAKYLYSIQLGKWSKVKFFLIVNFCPILLIYYSITFSSSLLSSFLPSSLWCLFYKFTLLSYSHQNSFSPPSIHAHSLITRLLLLLEPLLMLLHLPTGNVLLPLIYYLYLILYLEL